MSLSWVLLRKTQVRAGEKMSPPEVQMRRSCWSLKWSWRTEGNFMIVQNLSLNSRQWLSTTGMQKENWGRTPEVQAQGASWSLEELWRMERNPISILGLSLSIGCGLWLLGQGHNHQVRMPWATAAWVLQKSEDRTWKLWANIHALQALHWVQGSSLCTQKGGNRPRNEPWTQPTEANEHGLLKSIGTG